MIISNENNTPISIQGQFFKPNPIFKLAKPLFKRKLVSIAASLTSL